MLNHLETSENLPEYALGSLNDDLAVAVSEHVAGCAACRSELLLWQAVADQLALAAPPGDPPPALEQRLMRQIAPPIRAAAPKRSDWLAWLRRTSPLWAAAAMLLLAVLGVNNLNLRQQVLEHQQHTAPMAAIPMYGASAEDPASGVVVVSADGEYGTLVVQHLPELPDHQVYQLWLIENGQRTNGGTFKVDEHGYTALEIESPQDLVLYDAFGVTVEPAGGSPGPTGPKVLGSP
ncbi:MAG: anti-sigma factor [Anaerolineae bacterium]